MATGERLLYRYQANSTGSRGRGPARTAVEASLSLRGGLRAVIDRQANASLCSRCAQSLRECIAGRGCNRGRSVALKRCDHSREGLLPPGALLHSAVLSLLSEACSTLSLSLFALPLYPPFSRTTLKSQQVRSPLSTEPASCLSVDLTLDTLSTTTIRSLPISKQSLHSIHLSLAFTSPSISSATTRQLFLSSSLPTPFSLPLLATLSTYATRNLAARYPLIFDGAHIQSLELDRQHHVTLARCLLYLAGPLLPPSPKRKRRRRVAAEDDSVLSVDDEEESQEEVERALMRVCLGGLQYRKVVFGGKVRISFRSDLRTHSLAGCRRTGQAERCRGAVRGGRGDIEL